MGKIPCKIKELKIKNYNAVKVKNKTLGQGDLKSLKCFLHHFIFFHTFGRWPAASLKEERAHIVFSAMTLLLLSSVIRPLPRPYDMKGRPDFIAYIIAQGTKQYIDVITVLNHKNKYIHRNSNINR